jgi:RNA polymerase sigma factor (sigma-70 family)
MTDADLEAVVERAKAGDSDALESLVRALQNQVYRLALRTTGNVEDARDACQEILVKIVTRLESFRGDASIRTWAYQIAVRHVIDRKRSRVEQLALSFERFGEDLLDGLAAEPSGDPLMIEEVKLGCTLAMLTCLDREHRLAYLLADVFDIANADAAAMCEVTEDTYRQRLSRARRMLEAFTTSFCGLVDDRAPCRCDKRVARAEELGRIERGRPRLAVLSAARHDMKDMESLHASARLLRSHPNYTAPADLLEGVRTALRQTGSRLLN